MKVTRARVLSLCSMALMGTLMLSACGGSTVKNVSQQRTSEFAAFNYKSAAYDCGFTQMVDPAKYSEFYFFEKTSDFDLLDMYPEFLQYSQNFDSWADQRTKWRESFSGERVRSLACLRWIDKLDLIPPGETNFPNAWATFQSSIGQLREIISERVSLIENMHKLQIAQSTDKKKRNEFYANYKKFWEGERLGYEIHLDIRLILEYKKFNEVNHFIVDCPTYVQVTDLYGQIVTRSKNGLMKVTNSTDTKRNFSGVVKFKNSDGIVVARQYIDINLPAGKSFNIELKAIKGEDTYSGAYPPSCSFR